MIKNLLYIGLLLTLVSCNAQSNENKIILKPAVQQSIEQKSNLFYQQILANSVEIESNGEQLSKQHLDNFSKKLNHVKIIGLGEQTHGSATVFKLKTQLVKYLHQHHDFDVLLFESGMFDVKQIWKQAQKGQSIKIMAPGNIFYMYAKNKEVSPLFDYINQQALTDDPLIFAGFDSQHSGNYSINNLLNQLTVEVKNSTDDWTTNSKWKKFKQTTQEIIQLSKTRLSPKDEMVFFQQLKRVQRVFLTNRNKFWYRIAIGLESQAKRQWKISDSRSQEMGENIKWLISQYPNKKILIWGHTFHLSRLGVNEINAGEILSKAFGKQYLATQVTASAGSYLDFVNFKIKRVKQAENNSIESLLNKNIKTPYAFVDFRKLNVKEQETKMFSVNYHPTVEAKYWKKYWDGVFYIKQITPTNYQPTKEQMEYE